METLEKTITLTKKQLESLTSISKDREEIQKLANLVSIREKEVLGLILDFENVDSNEVVSAKIEQDKLIVTLK